jgi:H+-transporting ATPase
MNSYAIYRIAETLRVLFFMTLAILIFNFYPLTAVMIVMLALLNDGAILSIAYDNVHYKDQPEAWNMRMVLGISTVLGVIGVVAAFGLFYLGERVFHLDRPHIQTLMYLKLSVAGHLTIFLTRTRGAFWSIRPAKILWMAVLGTQTVATLIAVYGLFMTPLGWGWAGFVWAYAVLWFLVNDRIKLLAYRILDPVTKSATKPEVKVASPPGSKPDPDADAKTSTKPEAKPEAKTEAKSDRKAETRPEAKAAEPKPEATAEQKPDAKAAETKAEAKPETNPKLGTETKPEAKSTPDTKAKAATNLTPQIAARAYELYQRQGNRDGQSVQNWEKAEREIRAARAKAEPKAETKPAAKAESEPETNAQPDPDANSKPKAGAEPTPATKAEPKPDAKPGATPEPKPKAKTEAPPEGKAPATPEAKAVPPSAAKAEPKPDAKTDVKPTDKIEPKPDAQTETKPEPNAKPAVKASTQLATKVHKFYEQLGREDVRAVQDADEAKQKTGEVETKK